MIIDYIAMLLTRVHPSIYHWKHVHLLVACFSHSQDSQIQPFKQGVQQQLQNLIVVLMVTEYLDYLE
jgi:hypothetical protein